MLDTRHKACLALKVPPELLHSLRTVLQRRSGGRSQVAAAAVGRVHQLPLLLHHLHIAQDITTAREQRCCDMIEQPVRRA